MSCLRSDGGWVLDQMQMDTPENFLNRELSLLAFHKRVLAMAQDDSLPLLERLRFLCISSSNLDEFFEVRVAAVRHLLDVGKQRIGSDQVSPARLLRDIREQVAQMVTRQYDLLNQELIPALAAEGIHFVRRGDWNDSQRAWLKDFFDSNIMPMISPLGIDPSHPFPRIANKILHFIVSLEGRDAFGRAHNLAIVPAPRSLPRLIRMPEEVAGVPDGFVFLSSIIHAFVEDMFQGMRVTGCYQFRVTRDTELYLDEEEMEDIKSALEGGLQQERRFGRGVRLEVADNCPRDVVDFLLNRFDLNEQDLYQVDGLVNLYRLASLYDRVERPDLKFTAFQPSLPAPLKDKYSGTNLKAGCQNLDGAQALSFVRDRHSFVTEDLQRIQDQRAFLKSLMAKAMSPGVYLNPFVALPFASSAASSITVDKGTNTYDLLRAALALRHPETTTVPVAHANYFTPNAGDALLWNQGEAAQLFRDLAQNKPVPKSLLSGTTIG